jgi:lysophospholipase L1-like esterase
MNKSVIKITAFLFLIFIILLLFEVILRFYNLNGKNYDIEMWKYGKLLTRRSKNAAIGIEHIPLKKAKLQNIEIKINSVGFRDKEYLVPKPKDVYRIIVLGSSLTFGWGVAEEKSYVSLVERWLEGETGKKKIEIINTSVCNYNSVRKIEAFFEKSLVFEPDMIILSFFINDAENLQAKRGSFLLRNSQLAVLLWTRYHQVIRRIGITEDIVNYYKKLYSDDSEGWLRCQQSMKDLANYSKENQLVVLLTMIPEIHNLQNYPYKDIHAIMRRKAAELNFSFLDFYDALKNVEAHKIWAMRGDPHPNEKGHLIMARFLYNYLIHNRPWEGGLLSIAQEQKNGYKKE